MTIQQLIRTADDQQTATPDLPRVVPILNRRRTFVGVAAGAVAVVVIAAGTALVVGRPAEPDPATADTGASAPTVGEAVHGGPGSLHDAQAAAYAALGLPGADGPTAPAPSGSPTGSGCTAAAPSCPDPRRRAPRRRAPRRRRLRTARGSTA